MSDTDGDGFVDDFADAATLDTYAAETAAVSDDAEPADPAKRSEAPKLRGCGVFIFDEADRLLMMQRGPACRHEQFKWEVPGGALGEGESYGDAIRREVLEEIGVHVELDELIARYDALQDPNGDVWEAETYRGHLAPDEQPSVQEPTKCVGFGWFTRQEVLALNRAEYLDKDLKAFGWL